MSLKTCVPAHVPVETAGFVEPLLSEESVYRFIGQQSDHIIGDDDLAGMYAEAGRSGVNPIVVALVTDFRFWKSCRIGRQSKWQ